MIKEILVLTSSSVKDISVGQLFFELNGFKWVNLGIEIAQMPQEGVESPIKNLDQFPESTKKIIKSLETPIESISISGIIEDCSISLTALVDNNTIKWVEVYFEADTKVSLEATFEKFNVLLKKNL
ncbi:MAG: hypothetical protein EU551_02575 [Promethearchaeota archaeon]|nr:MAG: hypothetical protein EU551_02575 [Candidatus Lokiarchaeota archaeon]